MVSFQEQSKHLINDYVSSVVYIDDEIFPNIQDIEVVPLVKMPTRESSAKEDNQEEPISPEIQHIERRSADPLQMTKVFSEKGIQCVLLQHSSEDDLEYIEKTISKSDIVVLDWQMQQDQGMAAIAILKAYLGDLRNGMHLFLIWTAEPDLDGIVDSILKEIPDTFKIVKGTNVLLCGFSKIIVCHRSVDSDDESGENGITQDKLPDFIIDSLLPMTSGLVSNTLLQSIVLLKRHSANLLTLFNKDLDSAYLEHRSMLSNPEDGEEMLIKMIIDSFSSLIQMKNATDCCNASAIASWIDENIKETRSIIVSGGKKKDLSPEILKSWQKSGYRILFNTEAEANNFEKEKIKAAAQSAFGTSNEQRNTFSELSFKKTSFDGPQVPFLSLGSVVKQVDVENENQYYVCIQQRCDSIRISKDEGGRAFLFLPLKETGDSKTKSIHILIEGRSFVVDTTSYNVELFTFEPSKDDRGVVVGNDAGVYESVCGKKFKWLFDLKDLHAQRIAQTYSSNLSRVGLDESEALRRNMH